MIRRVAIVQRRLTEYRVPLLERLRALLAVRGVILTVVHGTPAADEASRHDEGVLPWAVRTRTRYLRVLGRRLSWTGLPRAIAAAQDLVVVTHENGILSSYPLLARARLGGPRVAWWGHGPKILGTHAFPAERAKAVTARWGTRYFAYTEESVRRVVAAGVPADRVTCLDNAIAFERHPLPGDGAWDADRRRLAESLGLGDGPVAIHLGSLSREKRVPVLVAAADRLRDAIPGFRLLVVGDGPLAGEVRSAAATRPWLRWLGARHGREKALACSLGHAMLNPGMVGLNVVDAFAAGVPLVTMRHDLHSPEIAYLEHGRNGLVSDDDLGAFVAEAARALGDPALRAVLRRGCEEAAARYTIEGMARRFADGIARALEDAGRPPPEEAAPVLTVAVVLRKMLPYHRARLAALRADLGARGIRLHDIEVASSDAAYRGFGVEETGGEDRHCCFPGVEYQTLDARTIQREVLRRLEELRPDVVIGHATPFPEGMAAIAYRNRSAARVFVVDDAWAATDRSREVVRAVKRVIHESVDGAIVSSGAHAAYHETLGIPRDRIAVGWSVVDNRFHAEEADAARAAAAEERRRLGVPERYFLFVGRFLARKGIDDLLRAYGSYREASADPRALVLVGGTAAELGAARSAPGVVARGAVFGRDLARIVGLAGALVVPSRSEQWGLVVNEGMAAGAVVVVSRACGAAQLVADGVSGFTFDAGDVDALASTLARIEAMPEEARAAFGDAARAAIAGWGLERFVAAVNGALRVPRRMAPGLASRCAVRLWKGHVRSY